jgi:glyoxylase-like metal-dependent hydrolase (beta-lactamase superfamily II)
MKLIQETQNLYRLTRFGMVNCFLVREAEGFTLIDTGLRGSAPVILQAASSLGTPIRRIALTHAHIDHVGSLDALLASLPGIEFVIAKRESRLLKRDFTLDTGETGKALHGFTGANATPTRLLAEGDRVSSLQAIASPGHTPGHFSYLDLRDNSLIAGDAFVTQGGLIAAGVFKPFFPFSAIFSWNATIAAQSADKLRALKPPLLATGHGVTLFAPARELDRAVKEAFRQHPQAANK